MFSLLFAIAFAAKWTSPNSDSITVKYGYLSTSYDMTFKSFASGTGLQYIPNVESQTFIGVAKGGLSARLTLANPPNEENERLYGKTSYSDFQFRLNWPQISVDLFYQGYKGYYLGNTTSIDSTRGGGDPRYQYPDLKTELYQVGVIYNFHPDAFSISSAFDQLTYQTESAISLLGYAGLNRVRYDLSSGVIPAQVTSQFQEFSEIKITQLTTARVGVGFGGALVYNQFFFSVVTLVLTGIGNQTIEKVDGSNTSASKTVSGYNARVSIGYNSDTFLGGIYFIGEGTKFEVAGVENELATKESGLYIGYRF